MWSPHYAESDGLRDVRCAAGHFAAISSVIATQGLGILLNYASFIGGYYVAILLTCLVLLAVGYMVLKKRFYVWWRC